MDLADTIQREQDEQQNRLSEPEAALRESERRLKYAQAAAGAGIWDWDIPADKIFWTEELFRLFGLNPAEIEAGFDPWRAVIHPEDRQAAQERIEQAITAHAPLSSEYRIVLPSGEIRWVSALGSATYGENGTPLRMSGICIDITSRKQTENLARQRLTEIEALYRNAPVGLCMLDRDLRYLRINERLAEINGVPAADHIGKRVRDLLPGLAGIVEPEMRRTLETGQPRLDIEIKGSTPARPGVERSWMEQWLPITDDEGHVVGLNIVVEETTERRRTEAALRDNEQRLRQLIDASPIAIGFGDSTGRIFEANESFYRLTGYTREEMEALRLGWDHVTAPEYAEVDREIMATLAATGVAGPYEKEYIRKDGRRVPLLLSVLKLPGRDEHIAFIVDITDRKRAETAVETQRRLLETVVQHMPVAMNLIRGSDLRLQMVNPAYQAIAPGKDMVGKTLDELWPETGQDFAALCRRVLETGEPHEVLDDLNMIRRTPGGPLERAHFSWSLHRVRLPGDEGWGILNAAWETTGRLVVEEALRRSQEDLIRAEEVARLGWWRLDTQRNILTWSDENHRVFGVPKGTPLTYQTFLQCVHPDDRQYVDAKWTAGLAGEPYDLEHRLLVDGRVKWVREKAFLEFDDGGALRGGFGITQDITERKLAEEALRRAEEERKVAAAVRIERERLLNVLESLPAKVCLLTPDYHVAFANRSFRQTFGESEGRRCHEYCFGRSSPCEFCQNHEVLRTGEPRQWEATTPNGTVIDVYDLPFTDADGSPMVLEMALDVTERRRIEGELQRAHENLAERAVQLRALAGEITLSAQRERRRLARILHDHLQQLLVGAKFRTAIVARMGDDLIEQAATEIERLLEESIAASRSLTAELSPPILQESGLTTGLSWLARWMADRHGLRVDLSIDDDLPGVLEDVRVLLFESVRELLFNAVKHAHVASVAVNVRRVTESAIQIVVSDAGPGFDPATLKKAGEIGGGFGLFGIREQLELMGGRIDIDSAPGKGSRFTLTAPLEKIARSTGPAPIESASSPQTRASRPDPRGSRAHADHRADRRRSRRHARWSQAAARPGEGHPGRGRGD